MHKFLPDIMSNKQNIEVILQTLHKRVSALESGISANNKKTCAQLKTRPFKLPSRELRRLFNDYTNGLVDTHGRWRLLQLNNDVIIGEGLTDGRRERHIQHFRIWERWAPDGPNGGGHDRFVVTWGRVNDVEGEHERDLEHNRGGWNEMYIGDGSRDELVRRLNTAFQGWMDVSPGEDIWANANDGSDDDN